MYIAAMVLYGLVAGITFLMLRYELDVPASVAVMLTVPAVAVGAALAGSATYLFKYSFMESSLIMGVSMAIIASVYVVEFD